jgi:hypothetical protein
MLPPSLRAALVRGTELRRIAKEVTLRAVRGTPSERRTGTPRYLILLLAPMPHTRYHVLQFDAASGAGGGAVGAATFWFDSDSNSDQSYFWEHRAPASVIRVSGGTRRAHLTVNSGLAGADMAFTATRATHHRTFGCNAFFAPTASTVTWTIGRLNGTFSFTPREDGLQAHADSVRALVEKIVPTGEQCPHRHFPCIRQLGFEFGQDDAAVVALAAPPRSQPFVDGVRFRGGSRNFEFQDIEWFPLDSNPVTRTPTSVSFDGSNAGPFLSGTISFDRTGPTSIHQSLRCTRKDVGYTWSSGSITLNFDAGPVTLTDPDVEAESYRYTPRS